MPFVCWAVFQFWPKLTNFQIFGPFWPMSKCAQLSYLISKNLQNSVQPILHAEEKTQEGQQTLLEKKNT